MKLRTLLGSCVRLLDAPAGSKFALFGGLIFRGSKRMGFHIQHPDPVTIDQLYYEIFVRQYYFFAADRKEPVIFDCGANVGVATMYFKWLYPHSRVHCFEADEPTIALLRRNVAENHLTDITVHHCALWDNNGEIDFFSDPRKPSALSMSTDPSYVIGHQTKVTARRLSDFISEPVDFLKIDIEGAEHRVLSDLITSGKISLIRRMVIEYHHRIGKKKSRLASFLEELEGSGFDYQLDVSLFYTRQTRNETFQAMHIACYRD
jgi:FkbM family methyltransferase